MCFSLILLAISPEICSNTIVLQISWQLYAEISCLAGFNLEKPRGHLSSAKWGPHRLSSSTFKNDILWPSTLLHSWVYDFNDMLPLLPPGLLLILKLLQEFSHLIFFVLLLKLFLNTCFYPAFTSLRTCCGNICDSCIWMDLGENWAKQRELYLFVMFKNEGIYVLFLCLCGINIILS